ncbi:MAG: hypothetical protein K9J17_05490 [Flavobacteriales bacterium]|nr:hypothetical protein [Flavobacteriales bacterium]
MEVFSTDVKPFEKIDLVKDVLELTPKDIPFIPDVIWASPPCTGFSVASSWKHWKGKAENSIPVTETALLGIKLVKKTLKLIRHYQKFNPNLIWYIENPRGKLRHQKFMQNLPFRHTVTYCQYGDFRMKPTDIWTNNPNWKPRPMCKPRSKCHDSAPKGSHGGTQGLKNNYERSKIPKELCVEVMRNAKK